jgi:RimJ/RimL family protein N-acetyltransferase
MSDLPIGPLVDTTPRQLPARGIKLHGSHVELEPLHPRHAADLFRAAETATARGDASWTYLGYGPFASVAALEKFLGDFSTQFDHVVWAVRPIATGVASGWLTLMNIEPKNSAIELGNIWLAPVMQRTRAATEAMFLPLRYAADDLGYRRLVWKCNALNAPSRRAADRLGFAPEGVHRAALVVKERLRDTAWFSIVGDEWPRARDAMRASKVRGRRRAEWPRARDAIVAWLDAANFSPDGTAKRSLAEIRAALAA